MTQAPSPLQDATPSFEELAAEVEARLPGFGVENPYPCYRYAFDTARRMLPLDSFYICLWDEEHRQLFFPYNAEDVVYDPPRTHPLGDGPTSWVVLNDRPFVLDGSNSGIQLRGVPFGRRAPMRSGSAIHVPMRSCVPGSTPRLIGVMAAMSFETGAYASEHVSRLQWLAHRIGHHLVVAESLRAGAERLSRAEARHLADRDRLVNLAAESTVAIREIQNGIGQVSAALPSGEAAAREVALRVRARCTDAISSLLARPFAPNDEAMADASGGDAALTARERQVMDLLAEGAGNDEMAVWLGVSVSTVKFHLKNVFAKLGVGTRLQASRAWREMGGGQRTTRKDR